MTNIVPLGGELERLSRKLEHEAQMFLARKRDGRFDTARRWLIFDLEFLFDRSRYQGYTKAEGKDARCDGNEYGMDVFHFLFKAKAPAVLEVKEFRVTAYGQLPYSPRN